MIAFDASIALAMALMCAVILLGFGAIIWLYDRFYGREDELIERRADAARRGDPRQDNARGPGSLVR